MNLVFERIQASEHFLLKDLTILYMESFPPEERRDPNALLDILDDPQMYFNALLLEKACVGLLIYWKFEGFIYVEHLAIAPGLRGRGIGSGVLQELRKFGDPVLLEVEIPYDDWSQRRVSFYNQCGFNALPINYFQPPYREGESLLPMMLFSNQIEWQKETLKRNIGIFHDRVYHYRIKGDQSSF